MTSRLQSFLLRNTQGLQYVINQRLAKREGTIGSLFKFLQIGERQYGHHSLFRFAKVVNYYWVMMYHVMAMQR